MNASVSTGTEKAEHGVAIYWYRNALRFHDNPSLLGACKSSKTLLPLYIIDPEEPFSQTPGVTAGCIRANFILESIREVDQKLRNQYQSQLFVVLGKPQTVLPRIIEALQVTDLYFEREPALPIRESDERVLEAIRNSNAKTGFNTSINGYHTHTIHPMELYLAKCKGNVAPSSYGGFTKIFQSFPRLKVEVKDVVDVPPLPPNAMATLHSLYGDSVAAIPSLEDLGYDAVLLQNRSKGGIEFPGGEDFALQLLAKQMSRSLWVSTFEKPNTSPNALTVDTTGLSPYVKHGCLSPRRFFNALTAVYSKFNEKNVSKPPVSLHGQLMWREYNYLMCFTTPNCNKTIGNPIARQIPWDDDPELLLAWKESRTGYPYIDAIMTQLRETGWIHHLARHSVACFLTRGDLWQSWEKGLVIFEHFLIDADFSINVFNWQWLSCTAHFYQYFRCYSPIGFGKKTDPNGDYIRKWLPQFKNTPKEYIYEPWEAPIDIQRKCGVIVGVNYPHPIVEHKTVSKSNMLRMKEVYDAHNAVKKVTGNEGSPKKRPRKA